MGRVDLDIPDIPDIPDIQLRYVLDFVEMPEGEYLKTIGECLPEDKGLGMSLAEQLRQQGLQQGLLNGKFEVARGMLAEGINEELIQKITKLSKEDLLNLKKENKH